MTENISQKIDLRENQVEANLLDTLNSEEKQQIIEALNKYREETKNSEKLGVIILTKDELLELKDNIHQPDNLNNIIEKQLKETITTSEILEGTTIEKNLGGKQNLEKFTQVSEKAIYNYLFQTNDSLLGHLGLNEDAKNNIVVGFNFFVFDFLSKNKQNFDIENNISYFTDNIGGLLQGNFSNIGDILSIGDKGSNIINNLKSSFGALSGKLEILKTELNSDIFSQGGENNEVIMNPSEAVKFFNGVLDGSINNIQSYVIQKQTSNPILIEDVSFTNLKEIGNKWGELIPESVGTKLGGMSDVLNNIQDYKETIKLGISKSPKTLEVLAGLESLPLVGELLKFFADLLGIGSFENMYENSQFGEIQKELSELFKNKELFIYGLNISDNFLKIGNKNDIQLLQNLKFLSNGSSQYKKTMEGLLKKGSDFETFNKELQNQKIISPIQDQGDLHYSSLSTSIDYYRQYQEQKEGNTELSLKNFISIIKKNQEQQKAVENSFEPIIQKESFEKNNDNLVTTCEINGQWYNATWNKHGEIQLQSENKKYFYFIESISAIGGFMNFENTDFFAQHGDKITLDTVKSIIPVLLKNGTKNNQLSHLITTPQGDVNFTINTTNVIDKQLIDLKSKPNENISQNLNNENINKDQGEKFKGNMYSYKSMSLISPFNRDKEIRLVDEDGKSVTYKLNYKNSLDWANEIVHGDVVFDIKEEGGEFILKNNGLGIKINLKELYEQLHTGINQVDIQKNNFFGLEFEKVED